MLSRVGKIEANALAASKVGKLALALVKGLDGGFRTRCIFEWFYSSLDEAYFMHNDFELRVDALALQGISLEKWQRLTRFEWAVVRQKIGCPRRFSAAFLRDERKDLERYRRDVRGIQNSKGETGKQQKFPYAVFHRLEVGMRVTAVRWSHSDGELSTGVILTVDHEKNEYQVQWDIPRLGVTYCQDFDIRPSSTKKIFVPGDGVEIVTHATAASSSGILDTGLRGSAAWVEKTTVNTTSTSKTVGVDMEEDDGKEQSAEDRRGAPRSMQSLKPMADVLAILDRKEVILAEIKHMNEQVKKLGPQESLSKDFKNAYAWLLDTLSLTNTALEPALQLMRETFLDNPKDVTLLALDGENKSATVLDARQREFADRWLLSSKVLVEQLHSAQLQRSQTSSTLNADVLNNAGCGISLLLAIRHCAEMYTSPSDVSLGIDAIVHRLQPKFEFNQDVFKEIVSLASLIKAGCTPR